MAFNPKLRAPDAETFDVPKSLRNLLFAGSAFFLVFALAAGQCAFTSPDYVLFLALFGFAIAAAFCYRSAKRLGYSITVDPRGIATRSNGVSTFLAWSEITAVKADDVMQRLIVVGPSRDQCIVLDYQIRNFSRLRELVLAHTSDPHYEGFKVGQKFYRTWINKIAALILSAPFLVFAIAAWRRQPTISALLALLSAYLLVMVVARDPVHVEIAPEGIGVHYVCRKLLIPYSIITDISLRDTVDRSNVWATVRIARHDQPPLNLYRFREGSLALHATLREAWLAHRDLDGRDAQRRH